MIGVKVRTLGDEAVFREVLSRLIIEHPETTLQRTPEEAFTEICEATEGLDKWVEMTLRDGQTGKLVAFAILADDHDSHVGRLLSVQWRIEFPEAPKGTTLKLQRMIVELAKMWSYRMYAYTKRLSMGRFEIIYRKV